MPDKGQKNIGQELAIHHGPGPMLVTAGPGSGKTYTITHRIRYLIEEMGVEPDSILVITFTKASAGEMKKRFRQLTGNKNYPVSFGTFHAVYYHILVNAYHYRSGNILSESDKKEILRSILLADKSPYPEEEELDELLSMISRRKNESDCGNSEVMAGRDFARIFEAYAKEIKRRRKLDFDDMVLQCRELFLQYPAVLKAWQQKFRYILVDEFQDINAVQYEVLRLLAAPENNLFAVGDDDQSIYAFRGARPEIMQSFLKDYPDAKRAELAVNYRSTPEIVREAGKLIRKNKVRIPKHILSGKTGGENVRYLGCMNRREENEKIMTDVRMDLKNGKSTAVIFRTNQEMGEISELLVKNNIPFHSKEKIRSPYSHPVCRDLISYLFFVFDGQHREDFYRIMNRPTRYLSGSALKGKVIDLAEVKAHYKDRSYMHSILRKLEIDIARISRMDLYAAVNYIRRGVGYDEWLSKENREWLKQAEWFQEQMKEISTVRGLKERIRIVEEATRSMEKNDESEGVTLITMHASKGLEYDSVYIPYCNEGSIPHKKSIRPEQIEEERRMFYVAMTRARDKLTITWNAGTKEEPGLLSRFLSDLAIDEYYSSESTSSSNSQLSRYSSKASATASYSSSSSI